MQPAKYRFTGFNKQTVAGIAENTAKALKGYQFGRFLLGCSFQVALSDDAKALLKKEFQPVLVKAMEKALKAKADFEKPEAELVVNFDQDLVFFSIKPVYISGRYRKLSRKITQTVHYCYDCKGKGCGKCGNTGILTKESVQSLVEKHSLQLFNSPSAKFHGSGREDKDVRMLGSGRKFVLEMLEPKKRKAGLKALQAKINKASKGKIEVLGLGYSSKAEVQQVKGEMSDKLYEATVECEEVIEPEKVKALEGGSFIVEQRTPTRVKERRADILRTRQAEIVKAVPGTKKKFTLQARAESGLYIKELVSGDFGRTKPSISSLLGKKCQCSQLDVLEIFSKESPTAEKAPKKGPAAKKV